MTCALIRQVQELQEVQELQSIITFVIHQEIPQR